MMRAILVSALMVLGLSGPTRGQAFTKHVVVAQEGNAADAGHAILRRGGNAVDAAVATALALAVTHPAAGNLGGGGFMVISLAAPKVVTTIDFRETAPGAATERMYLGSDGKPVPRHRAGPKAAGVPGTPRGLGLAHQKYGRLPWRDLVQPAIGLARDGFAVSDTLARSLNAQLFDPKSGGPKAAEDLGDQPERLADFAPSVAAYRRTDGAPWKAGDLLKQPDLAATLERLADGGPDEFYTGKTAGLIVASMGGEGIISRADLASYAAKERPPTHAVYRGHDVYGMGPPASGGILIAEMLQMLERFDLKADGPRSPRTLHRVAEAMRRAFFIRATEIADPDVVAIDVPRLTSRAMADRLAATIGDRATPSESLASFPIVAAEGNDTTHFSTLDSAGNAVALTYTLEEGYGSKFVVSGAGFLLNNEMGDFNLIPDRTDRRGRIGTKPNRIAPGKRMLSSQAPTIVLQGGKVRLVTGSPGGRTIPNTTLWVVLNILEFGLTPRDAVDAPRTHHPWFPDVLTLEGPSWEDATRKALEGMGHHLGDATLQGDAHTIAVDPATGRIEGVPDRRRATSKASGD